LPTPKGSAPSGADGGKRATGEVKDVEYRYDDHLPCVRAILTLRELGGESEEAVPRTNLAAFD
jgi:hypothetical protein